MLKSKLAPATLKHVKERADYFFQEQCKRIGPLSPIIAPLPVLSPVKRGRPRKANPGG